jgi:hypothetical protein
LRLKAFEPHLKNKPHLLNKPWVKVPLSRSLAASSPS